MRRSPSRGSSEALVGAFGDAVDPKLETLASRVLGRALIDLESSRLSDGERAYLTRWCLDPSTERGACAWWLGFVRGASRERWVEAVRERA